MKKSAPLALQSLAARQATANKQKGETSLTTGTTDSNVNRLTVPSSANLYIGQPVSGPLIAAGARITNINSGTQVTLSIAPATPATATTVDFPDILGSVAASLMVEVQSGATLDVTSYPWTLESTQTFGGNGTILGNVAAAGTISPGTSTGTLAFANDLKIQSSLVIEHDNTEDRLHQRRRRTQHCRGNNRFQ